MKKPKNKINIGSDLKFLLQDKYGGERSTKFLKDVKRIKAGEPVDYVIGWKPFLGCKIDLKYKPLIPRAETEFWVEDAIKEINKYSQAKVLDLFAGSGAIGLAVLKHCNTARVDFGEIEPDLARQITFNLKLNNFKTRRAKIFRSDVFEKIKDRYDFILANPPYIPVSRKRKVQGSVLKYEPSKALFGGEDGLFFIKKFVAGLSSHLLPGGQGWVEFDPPERLKIKKICEQNGLGCEFKKDQYAKWRFAVVSLESKQ